jgi:DNA-binding response OmpR family regulator
MLHQFAIDAAEFLHRRVATLRLDAACMASPRRILVADGDADWRARISEALAGPSHEVTAAASGPAALAFAQREKPDLLVTELMLPEMSGLGLCRLLREDPALGHLGIVMVTSFAAEIDRVLAFECGVDDLLPKPFFARDLLSRATAVLRRSAPAREPVGRVVSTYQPAVSLHVNTGTVLVAGERLTLTPREFHLLSALMRESGRVLSRRQLIHLVWGNDSLQAERVVDAHIKAIRRKLGAVGDCVETVRGVGYRYAEPHARAAAERDLARQA